MIMKLINNDLINNSLERALNSRFAGGRNIALFIALCIALCLVAFESFILMIFKKTF